MDTRTHYSILVSLLSFLMKEKLAKNNICCYENKT
jgi:hypothetical protein